MPIDPLLRRHPDFPLRPLDLGSFPTPVQRLQALEQGGTQLWCKREDLSGALYGGNKVRKLAWLLAEAKRRGGMLSLGAIGSNYLLAAGVYGREHGVPVDGVVFPQPDTPHVRDNALRLSQVVRLHPAHSDLAGVWALLQAARLIRKERGTWPLFAWLGGSTALGCLGWVSAGLELAEQVERGELPAPDQVVLSLGSGGMAAGLLVGLQLAGLDAQIQAVKVVDKPFAGRASTLFLARSTVKLLRGFGVPAPAVDAGRLIVRDEWLGDGYGHPTPEGREAMQLAQDQLGMTLELTYTAKSLAGCLQLMREGGLGRHALWVNSLSGVHAAVEPAAALPPELEALLL